VRISRICAPAIAHENNREQPASQRPRQLQ
jgi:hypothetical protein